MRLLPAPPSNRSEGSLRVRLLTFLVAAFMAAGCTTGSSGFTAAPQSGVPAAAPTASAAATASGTPSASAAPSATTSTSVPASAVPSASSAPASTPQPSAPPSVATVTYPLILTDDEANQVTLLAQPKRIVSITPATTEILFAIGAGDRLIANTDADDFPPQVRNLPHVATFSSVDVEQIVALQADLVIAGGNGFNKPDSLAQLRRLGIPVLVVYGADVEGVLRDISLVAQAVGQPTEGDALVATMRSEFLTVAQATQALAHPRTFYELDATKEIYGPADKSFIAEMITLAGGTPITTGSETVFSIPLEKLVAADPEVIVLGDAAYGTTAEIAAARPGWSTMTAVRNKAIRPVDDTVVSRPGPRLVEGLRDLALAIHPDLILPPLPSSVPVTPTASPGAAGSASPSASS